MTGPAPGPFGDAPILLVPASPSSSPRQDVEWSTEALADLADPGAVGRLRIHRPRPTAAFSRLDALAPGYPAAIDVATAHGFTPVVRPAGGRLAAYHQGCLVLDLVAGHRCPRRDIRARFVAIGECLAAGLRSLGVDARVGPVPGEFCPGEFSVNAAGATKLVGTAQRLTRNGYLFSAVVFITDPEPVRALLQEALALLGFGWRPDTVGCVADHVPGISVEEVRAALLPGLRRSLPLEPA